MNLIEKIRDFWRPNKSTAAEDYIRNRNKLQAIHEANKAAAKPASSLEEYLECDPIRIYPEACPTRPHTHLFFGKESPEDRKVYWASCEVVKDIKPKPRGFTILENDNG